MVLLSWQIHAVQIILERMCQYKFDVVSCLRASELIHQSPAKDFVLNRTDTSISANDSLLNRTATSITAQDSLLNRTDTSIPAKDSLLIRGPPRLQSSICAREGNTHSSVRVRILGNILNQYRELSVLCFVTLCAVCVPDDTCLRKFGLSRLGLMFCSCRPSTFVREDM